MNSFSISPLGLNRFLHRPDGGDASEYPRLSRAGAFGPMEKVVVIRDVRLFAFLGLQKSFQFFRLR
jgi:hypothetical protein